MLLTQMKQLIETQNCDWIEKEEKEDDEETVRPISVEFQGAYLDTEWYFTFGCPQKTTSLLWMNIKICAYD